MAANTLNPRTTSKEFLGVPGALFVTIVSPLITYALYFNCSDAAGGCPPTLLTYPQTFEAAWTIFVAKSTCLDFWASLWDTEATLYYLGWYAFTVVAWAVLPGDTVQGTLIRDGSRKSYKINGLSTCLLALSITAGYIQRYGPESLTFVYDKWVGLLTAALLNSIIQALYVYLMSFRKGKLLALGGNSGNPIYDFFIGRELNPHIGSFDIKTFTEIRPGFILWGVLDIAMACEQAVRRGGLSKVTDSMWLVLFFQGGYIFDCLYNETSVFTTMDVTSDGFGFMLSLGNLVWVPFVYSLQARYLAFNHIELGPLKTAAIFGFNAVGYYIFRTSNGEKDDFKNGKDKKNLKSFTTKKGSKLITSGWWGRSQHPNYLGDLIMAFAWSLPTGFNTPITYFYFVWFTVLLLHRQRRDDHICSEKHGEDWAKYKKLVPYRIVPYVY